MINKKAASRTVKPASEHPQISLYVAEDFREEVGGTVTAVGLHTTRSLTVNVAPDAVFNQEHSIAIPSLSFLVAIRGFIGEKLLSCSFEVPSKPGELISSRKQQHTFKSTNEGVNFIIRGQPFLFHEFGKRWVVVDVGDHREKLEFELLRSSISPQHT